MTLASLQLTKLLTQRPALLPRYAACYRRLLLHGVPVSDDVEAHLEVSCYLWSGHQNPRHFSLCM